MRLRLLRLARRRVRRSACFAHRRRYGSIDGNRLPTRTKRFCSLYVDGQILQAELEGEAIPVPKVLAFAGASGETLAFLADMREQLITSWQTMPLRQNRAMKRSVYRRPIVKSFWDFSTVDRISPEAALIIAAEYDRIRYCGGWLPRAVNVEKWQPGVIRMLSGIGFLDMLRIGRNQADLLKYERWGILRFRSCFEADGQKVDELLAELGVHQIVNDPHLYDAILEAATNAKHHAYPPGHKFEDPHMPAWWITGFVDHDQNRVRISVYDQGLTIPRTLPTWSKYPSFIAGFKRLFNDEPDPFDDSRDGQAIAVAMEVGESSTGESYRGRGLPQIAAAIDSCVDGQLTIRSRRGAYMRQTGQPARFGNQTVALGGTLITWDMQF